MLKDNKIKKLAATSILSTASTGLCAAPSSLSLQYGNNFEDQNQIFADIEFSIGKLGYMVLGAGTSDYDITNRVTFTTDYYSVTYSSPRDADTTVSIGYDHSELGALQGDSYTADLWHYSGNWSFGLHPEAHYITLARPLRSDLEYRNAGGGISLGYIANNNLYLYAAHYRYEISGPHLNLFTRNDLPLLVDIVVDEISSKFDDQRTTVGADYYFEKVSLGIERKQVTAVVDNSEYTITTFSSTLSLSEHWLAGISIDRTRGYANEFYTFTLSYDW